MSERLFPGEAHSHIPLIEEGQDGCEEPPDFLLFL